MDLYLEQYIPSLQLKKQEGDTFVLDPCRKKYVLFTPEEMIRQLLIQYFIGELKIPASIISIEKSFKVNDQLKRYDVVILSPKSFEPLLIVEIKRSEIPLDHQVIEQVSVYNLPLKCNFLMVSNGRNTYIFENNNGHVNSLFHWPVELLYWKSLG